MLVALQAQKAVDAKSASLHDYEDQGQHQAEFLALQQELAEVTSELAKREGDHSWTLEQLARGQEKERARSAEQLRWLFLTLHHLQTTISPQFKQSTACILPTLTPMHVQELDRTAG